MIHVSLCAGLEEGGLIGGGSLNSFGTRATNSLMTVKFVLLPDALKVHRQ